jgi:hypothetical protein
MLTQKREDRIKEYKSRVESIRTALRRKNKYWIKDFIAVHFPDKVGDQEFYSKFTNFVYGRSWESANVDPGFMPLLEKYYSQTITKQ